MTNPTGPDPDLPPQGQQPGWGAPPPQGYNPQGYQPHGNQGQPYQGQPYQGQGYQPAPSYSGDPAPAGRPGMVTAAAIIGIVIGALGVLAVFSLGTYFAFDIFLGMLNLLSVGAAVVLLMGGIQAMQGKSPRLLLLGSYASIGVQVLTLIWAVTSGFGFVFLGLLGFVLPGLIVFLLMQPQSKQYYAAQGFGAP
jgi:hypothetical protein